MKSLIQFRKSTALFASALLLACFALRLAPNAFGVVPAPDGGYPGFNTAEGQKALFSLTTGVANTAVGWFSLFSDTDGSFNTAVGTGTLLFNVGNQNTGEGTENTAVGTAALLNNTTGDQNTANGTLALFSNTTGYRNTAVGDRALSYNTTGGRNTAIGNFALVFNSTGGHNTAIGESALRSNNGGDNTAIGESALFGNTTGAFNTAIGEYALLDNSSGTENTAIGNQALSANTTGAHNTAIGGEALFNNTIGFLNTAIGLNALGSNITGANNTALGNGAGSGVTTVNNVICIGADGANVNNSCYIGHIWNESGGSQAVYVNSDGKLGAQVSSRRFKDEIRPMEQASEAVYGLRPVSFRYKEEIEPTRPLGFGLIAEEVEEISPYLVTHSSDGQANSVRYDAVNAMLLNEFLKEHKRVQDLEATVAQQQRGMNDLTARLKDQAAQIQRVSAKVELGRSARHKVANKN